MNSDNQENYSEDYQDSNTPQDTFHDDYKTSRSEDDLIDSTPIKKKEDNGKLQYSALAFHLMKPGSTRPTKSYRIKNKTEHQELLALAKKKKVYVGYSDYVGGQTLGPIIVDFDSVDAIHGKPEEYPTTKKQSIRITDQETNQETENQEETNDQEAPKKEPTLAEIMSQLNEKIGISDVTSHTSAPRGQFDNSVMKDINYNKSEASETNTDLEELKCPYCNVVMKSKSGKTLHIKSKHKEKTEEKESGGETEDVEMKEREKEEEGINEGTEKTIETEEREKTTEERKEEIVTHPCPYCNTVMKSKSGLTLHIKAKHAGEGAEISIRLKEAVKGWDASQD